MILRLKLSIALYLFFVFIIMFFKPMFIFNNEGEIKEFGTGDNKTIMPLWLLFALLSVVSYYLILLFTT